MKRVKRLTTSPTVQKIISQVALNAAEAGRTITVDCRDVDTVGVIVNMTARAAATSLVVTPTVSVDGTTYMPLCGVASGTLSQDTRTLAISSTGGLATSFDVTAWNYAKFVISGANGGANDLIDAYATGVST